jgi:hypothetical protein
VYSQLQLDTPDSRQNEQNSMDNAAGKPEMMLLTTFLSITSMNSVASSKSSPKKDIHKHLINPSF